MRDLSKLTIDKVSRRIPLGVIANKWVNLIAYKERYETAAYACIDSHGIMHKAEKIPIKTPRLCGADLKRYGFPGGKTVSGPILDAYVLTPAGGTYTDFLYNTIQATINRVTYSPFIYTPVIDIYGTQKRIYKIDKHNNCYYFNNQGIWDKCSLEEAQSAGFSAWAWSVTNQKRFDRLTDRIIIIDTFDTEDYPTGLALIKDWPSANLEWAVFKQLKLGDTVETYRRIRNNTMIFREYNDKLTTLEWLIRDPRYDAVASTVISKPIIEIFKAPESKRKRKVFDYITITFHLKSSSKEQRNVIVKQNIKYFTDLAATALYQNKWLGDREIPVGLLAIKRIEIKVNDLVYTVALKEAVEKVLTSA